MERIGIPVELFTMVRATLIVVVAVMIAFVYYRRHEGNTESSDGTSSLQSEQIQLQPGIRNGNTGMQIVPTGIPSEQPGIRDGKSVLRTGNSKLRIEQTEIRNEQSVIPPVRNRVRDEQSGNSVVIREVRDELPQLPSGNTRLTKEGLLEVWASSAGNLNIPELATEYRIAKTTLYGWFKGIKERACLVPAR
jgi:hypothetical protein